MSNWSSGPAGASVGMVDTAETFAESAVTLSQSATRVAGEAVEPYAATSPSDSLGGNSDPDFPIGVAFEPSGDVDVVEATARGVDGWRTWNYELRDSGGATLDTESGTGGDRLRFEAAMSGGSEYRIVVVSGDDNDSTYYIPRLYNPGFPISTAASNLTATGGVTPEGVEAPGYWYAVNDLTAYGSATPLSGTVYVEWPDPADVYAWDRCLFQGTGGDGDLQVYIEADDGTGWTEVAGPVSRGDSIPADPSESVRYRVEIDQSGPSKPALDAIYRRWVV